MNLNDQSCQPCGCDKGANHLCERHTKEAEFEAAARKQLKAHYQERGLHPDPKAMAAQIDADIEGLKRQMDFYEQGAAMARMTTRLPDTPLQTKDTNPKDLIGSDKLPLDLVPDSAIAYQCLAHLEGHLKYGLVNWREKGVRASIYMGACRRHLAKWVNGEWEDPETGVPHLGSAIACLNIIIDAYESGKLTDDRPKQAPVAGLIDRFSAKVKHLRTIFKDKSPHHYVHEHTHL